MYLILLQLDIRTPENNLELWEKFEETNPKYTKNFTKSGGFKGTSVNSTFVSKILTEAFGPWGFGWGWNIIDERYIEGAPLDAKSLETGREVVHVIRLSLWYEWNGKRQECPPHFGQTTFVGKNKYGPFTDEEAPKKSVTDAVTKSASMLGMAADIFSGRYDDNKYMDDLKEKYKKEGVGIASHKPVSKMDGLKDAAKADSAPKGNMRDLTGDPKEVLKDCLASFCGDNPAKRKSKLMMWGRKADLPPATLNSIKDLDDVSEDQAKKIIDANRESLAIPF